MTDTATDTAHGTARSATAQSWFAANAGLTWVGLTIEFALSASGMYPTTAAKPSESGDGNTPGVEGAADASWSSPPTS